MGRPKALLPIDGVRFIEKNVSSFQSTKVGKILVVLEHKAEEMRQKIADLPVLIVVNNEYKKGQLSSLVAAIPDIQSRQSSAELAGILVHFVARPSSTR